MGNGGYWILLWDGWGGGLVMINSRLLVDDVDLYGNPNNWFSEDLTDDEIVEKHNLEKEEHYIIIRSDPPTT